MDVSANDAMATGDCKVVGCRKSAPKRGRYTGYCEDHRHDRRSPAQRLLSFPTVSTSVDWPRPPSGRPLGFREFQVLQRAAEGDSAAQTAQVMQIALETVKSHRRKVLGKLGAANISHAITIAFRKGILH